MPRPAVSPSDSSSTRIAGASPSSRDSAGPRGFGPFTDVVLPELRQRGISRIAVVCPSFVADCLETLEEIGVRAREQWTALGGDSLVLAPCLNAHPRWVEGLARIVAEAAPVRVLASLR
jgi:hypothetical protein